MKTSEVKPGTFKMQFSQKNRSWISDQVMEGVREEFRLAQNSNKPEGAGKKRAGQPGEKGSHSVSRVQRTLADPGY